MTVPVTAARLWPLSSVMPPLGVLGTAASSARGHVRNVLREWGMGHLVDDAEMVVSELVANAVNASADTHGCPLYVDGRMLVVRVCLFSDGNVLLAEVWDQAPGIPLPRVAGSEADNGRGLAIVAELAVSWGCYPSASAKCVWAEMKV
jgi:anti-sigma regulatory factor (Ser/Thr protein kinase)